MIPEFQLGTFKVKSQCTNDIFCTNTTHRSINSRMLKALAKITIIMCTSTKCRGYKVCQKINVYSSSVCVQVIIKFVETITRV